NPATTKKWCRSGSGSKLKAAQKRGYLTCRPLFKNAPAAFLRARFLGAMRILSADQRSDSLTSMEIAPRKKCLRTSGLKAIMTSLPAAASHSDFRRRSHPDCRATGTGRIFLRGDYLADLPRAVGERIRVVLD